MVQIQDNGPQLRALRQRATDLEVMTRGYLSERIAQFRPGTIDSMGARLEITVQGNSHPILVYLSPSTVEGAIKIEDPRLLVDANALATRYEAAEKKPWKLILDYETPAKS